MPPAEVFLNYNIVAAPETEHRENRWVSLWEEWCLHVGLLFGETYLVSQKPLRINSTVVANSGQMALLALKV